jgi:hypothetical protein
MLGTAILDSTQRVSGLGIFAISNGGELVIVLDGLVLGDRVRRPWYGSLWSGSVALYRTGAQKIEVKSVSGQKCKGDLACA